MSLLMSEYIISLLFFEEFKGPEPETRVQGEIYSLILTLYPIRPVNEILGVVF